MSCYRAITWGVMFFSLLTGYFLTKSGYLNDNETLNTDIYHRISGVRHQPTATVVASLDSEALNFYPNTPLVFWGPKFALAIKRLKQAGALSIALDVNFAVTPEQWLRTIENSKEIPSEISDYDQDFDLALSEGKVVLAANPVHDGKSFQVPLPAKEYLIALAGHLEGVGLTTLPCDTDSKIRNFVPAFEGIGGVEKNSSFLLPVGYKTPNPWWTFATLAVKEGVGTAALNLFHGKSAYMPLPIAYCGPPMTIPRISLASLFREEGLTSEESSLVQGRIVFIGADFEGFGDHQPTPYSQSFLWIMPGYQDMSSVEIHANIAETILNPGRIRAISPIFAFLLWLPFMVAALIFCDLHDQLPIVKLLVDVLLLIIMWTIGLLFFNFGYILPQAGLFTAMTIFGVTMAIRDAITKVKKCNVDSTECIKQ